MTILMAMVLPDLAFAKWTPITREEIALTESSIEPGAGAEILNCQVSINDSAGDVTYYSYDLRVKIFNQQGIDGFLKYQIEYDNNASVSGIDARTHLPDGTSIPLAKNSIFDQLISRSDDKKIRAKSIALPGLQPGCVIEVRWVVRYDLTSVITMQFQHNYPARVVHYDFKRYEYAGFQSIAVNYRGNPPMEVNGRYQLEMTNVPAYKDEPYSLPAKQTKSWLLLWYANNVVADADKFWRTFTRNLYEQQDSLTKNRREIADTAKTTIAGTASEEEKLHQLYDYCITKIKNPNYGSSGYTEKARRDLKKNAHAGDTLKNGYGTGQDINYLFIALARSAGIDARAALCADHNSFIPSIAKKQDILFQKLIVAVPAGDHWRFFDPGSIFVPFGMLPPEYEGVIALIADAKKFTQTPTPVSPPKLSLKRRTAQLALDTEGTLTGTVMIKYTGHRSYELKYDLEDETIEEQQDFVRKEVTRLMPLAEVTDISVEGARSPILPLTISYQLRVPQYADRTGQRLLVQPAVFQKGASARFTADTRTNAINFRHEQTTADMIVIKLPPGFSLEEGSAPAPVNLYDLGSYATTLAYNNLPPQITYQRIFTEKISTIKPEVYPIVKQLFEAIHNQDNHTLSLLENTPNP